MSHWYDKTGQLMHTVDGAKGQQVKPDLRHARKLDLAPGCTTIIKSANRDALNVWRGGIESFKNALIMKIVVFGGAAMLLVFGAAWAIIKSTSGV